MIPWFDELHHYKTHAVATSYRAILSIVYLSLLPAVQAINNRSRVLFLASPYQSCFADRLDILVSTYSAIVSPRLRSRPLLTRFLM